MIEVNNLTSFSIDESFIVEVAEKVIKGEKKEGLDLSVAIVDSKEIKRINNLYRMKDKVTDVLSFSDSEVSQKHFGATDGLGEVLICFEKVKENASQQKIDSKEELARVLIHGILHLVGYDHETSEKDAEKMEKKQNYYLSNIN